MSETLVASKMSKAREAGWLLRRRNISAARSSFRVCRVLLFLITVSLLIHNMLSSRTIAALAATYSVTFALPRPAGEDNTLSPDMSNPDDSAAHWFYEFQDALATMQGSPFWTGYNWKSIQWTSAFFDALLGATVRSLTEVLVEYDGNIPGSYISGATIDGEISQYFGEIKTFYGSEDTAQIFGAAYDDAQWVVLEWLEAIRFIDEYDAYNSGSRNQGDIRHFAHRAHVFYNIVQNQFDTSLCGGGLTWNPKLQPYKNAITNELFMASSIAMYLYFPGDYNTDPYPSANYSSETNTTLPPLPFVQPHDPLFLDNAIKEYAWFKSQNFTNAQGLIVDGFHISENQTTCDERNEMVYTYNQGVILSGLRGLWEATCDPTYLSDGYNLIDTVINATGWNAQNSSETGQWAGLGRDGIMEDYCDASANCSQDSQTFKGIYFHHLSIFCEPLPTITPLVEGVTVLADEELAAAHKRNCDNYTQWITHNARAALSTRDQYNVIGGWWAANDSDSDSAQNAKLDAAAPLPPSSWDIRNNPDLLAQAPWNCSNGAAGQEGWTRGVEAQPHRELTMRSQKRDVNDGGRGRTTETQGSGLSVVKAASDFTRTRPAR
jgi:hypothetical protein